MTEDSG